MKAVFSFVMTIVFLSGSTSVLAQSSMLRVGCEGNDIGAEVSINGKFKGECPLDIQVSEGNLHLRIVKKVDAAYERVFEQDIRIGDGTVKRVDARLGPTQLNAEWRRLEAEHAEVARQREEARLREIELAQQQRQEAQARALAEFKAQGIEAGSGKAFRDCADCPEMVWIPPGKMPQREARDQPIIAWLNEVNIGYPLAVGKFEVSFDEWDRCVADGGCSKKLEEGVTYGSFFNTRWGRGSQPVVNVPMTDVQEYLAWLSKKSGQHYRLLSQAEFVYAARTGRPTHLPWGDEIGRNNANCRNCGSSTGGERPEPVGSFAANRWGLHDMVGTRCPTAHISIAR